jgi:hypothetical protein
VEAAQKERGQNQQELLESEIEQCPVLTDEAAII